MLVLAHRGYVADQRPENTVAAVAAAFDAGADGVEVDVRLTADGVLVCCHDADLLRLAGASQVVAATVAADLQLADGRPLARLRDVLATPGRVRRRIVVEAKPVAGADRARRTAAALHHELGVASLEPGVRVSSFDADLLDAIRSTGPVTTALLGGPAAAPAPLLRRALAAGHGELHLHLSTVLAWPGIVATAHTLGVAVTCWTVNRPGHLRRFDRLGVDAVITDDPVRARAVLGRGLPAAV